MSAVHRGLWAAAVALSLAAPQSVFAQWKPLPSGTVAATGDDIVAAAVAATLPSDIAAPFGGDSAVADAPVSAFATPALPGQVRTSRDAALMIVGGAAMIMGAVIGDDAGALMMVGGGVVGLIGLYQYLR